MIIAGIDPSLTATGLAVVDTRADGPYWYVGTEKSAAPKQPDAYKQFTRMQSLAMHVEQRLHEMAGPEKVDLAVIEAPAFSKNTGMAHERAGLWWLIYRELVDMACPILVVKPNVRAKYATGRGNAGKDEVMLAASRRYDECEITNNNEADAVILAAMGARWKGDPVEDRMPAAHLAAMRTVVGPAA